MLKRILLVLLFSAVLGFQVTVLGFQVAAEPMTLQVSHGTVSPGSMAEISVSISGNPGMIAYQMDIAYDDTMLVPMGVTKVYGTQPLVSNTIITDGGGHCIRLVYADTVSNPYNGILFTIKFQADAKLSAGQRTDISVSNCQFFDSTGGLIPVDIQNGYVKIQASQSSGSSAPSADPVSEGPGNSLSDAGSGLPISHPSGSATEANSSQSNRSVLSESSIKAPDPNRKQWILYSVLLIALSAILTTVIRKRIRSTGSHP
ncbi:MAG: cohesin domain-containing protein [Saccharofermentanales bacterium]